MTESALQASKIRLIMQLRRSGVKETSVLSAIESIPRDAFVEPEFSDQSYEDIALPIACEQTISQPTIVALMTQALELHDRHTVLEIGSGSGYQTAILAKLSRRVHSIERHAELSALAQARLEQLKIRNVTFHVGDGTQGWPHAAPFDRVMVTAAAFADAPSALLMQLADDGVMVIPIDQGNGQQTLFKITKEASTFVKTPLGEVRFVPLIAD